MSIRSSRLKTQHPSLPPLRRCAHHHESESGSESESESEPEPESLQFSCGASLPEIQTLTLLGVNPL